MAKVRVGISGWTYDGWKSHFYPEKLPKKKELEYASSQVNAIEVNGTFYRLMKPKNFQDWYQQTPKDFVFALKANRYITHVRQCKNVDEPMANFFASGLLCLKEKLGPILWQFPPSLKLNDDRFEAFMKQLPRTTKEAARLAKKHSEKVEGAAWVKALVDQPIQHAFEFRHPSFEDKGFQESVKKQDVALVFAHAGANEVKVPGPTAKLVYARMHGEGSKYKKGYPPAELDRWAKDIQKWKRRHNVFVFFDNDAKAHAPKNAMSLAKKLKL